MDDSRDSPRLGDDVQQRTKECRRLLVEHLAHLIVAARRMRGSSTNAKASHSRSRRHSQYKRT